MEALIAILFIVAVIAGFFMLHSSKEKAKAWEERLNSLDDFSPTQKHINWYLANLDLSSGIALDEQRKKICIVNVKQQECSFSVHSFHDLISSEIFQNGSSITRTARINQIAGTLIGGLALGAPGAIIGGLSSKRETQENIEGIGLRLLVNDIKNPLRDVTFFDKGKNYYNTEKLITNVSEAMEKARHWHGLMSLLVWQADKDDKISSKDPV